MLDLVYNPSLTQFLAYGQQRGAHVLNGRTMFVRAGRSGIANLERTMKMKLLLAALFAALWTGAAWQS